MSNNPPPNIIWLQWDGDAETPEPCTDDPDDRDVTWCRERVFNRDIQFERSDRITELKRELAELRKNTSELIASIQTELNGVESELFACREWSSKLADVADNLRAELATERELAGRLTQTLANVQYDYASTGAITTQEVDESLAAWKEVRSGSV